MLDDRYKIVADEAEKTHAAIRVLNKEFNSTTKKTPEGRARRKEIMAEIEQLKDDWYAAALPHLTRGSGN